jgi:hypothetical protein
MKVFRIESEWDLGFKKLYSSREDALKALNSINWQEEFEGTLLELMDEGLVSIIEEEVE